jgi:hypothetical protein
VDRLITQNELLRQINDDMYAERIVANQTTIDSMLNQEALGLDNYLKLRKKSLEDEKKQREFIQNSVIGGTASFFNSIMTLSRGNSREVFELAKSAALATAIIQGVVAVQTALANPPGPPFSIPQALAAGATAAVNVATIAGTGFARGTDMVRGASVGDSVLGILKPQERVVPKGTNAVLEEMLLDYRAMKLGGKSPGGGNFTFELSLRDGLVDFLEAKLIERGRLSTSLAA